MKKSILPIWLISTVAILLTSCGGGNEATNDDEVEQESPCSDKNEVFFQVEHYGYQFDSNYVFNGDFKVERTEMTHLNDSTAELNFYNYPQGAADAKDNFQIKVELHAKNGKKIEAGVYTYMDYDADLWCMTTLISSKGTVYFNWLAGMPEQGHVEVKHIDKEVACGKFMLSVNKPDRTSIGHVELKGSWSAK